MINGPPQLSRSHNRKIRAAMISADIPLRRRVAISSLRTTGATQQHYGHQGQEPSLDASAYHPDQQAYQQQHGTDPNAEYGEEEGYEDEPAPRGRFLRIAAALVGAIVVGGGLAYAYTSLVTPGNGSPPVIKSASGPSKIKPADAGGKKFANAEKKLMGQLNDGASSGDTDLSGVKKVGTLQVGADGSIMPPAEKPAEAPQTRPSRFPRGWRDVGFDAFAGTGRSGPGHSCPGRCTRDGDTA